jgi:hypothetical protein
MSQGCRECFFLKLFLKDFISLLFISNRLDDAITEVNRIVRLFICNHFNEALDECAKNLDKHFFFHVLNGLFRSIQGVVTFQDETLAQGIAALHEGLTAIDHHRRKRSRISRLIWTPDYNDYTDNECQAEGSYSVLSAFTSVMSILCEKSLVGLFKAGYWGKTAFDVLR